MSKTSMCFKMLQILNARGIVSVTQLADILQTNKRNIIEYKRELEDCGYDIQTISGRYGGYVLEKTALMPSLKLDSDEKDALSEGIDYLNKKQEFLNRDNFNSAVGKIFSSISSNKDNQTLTIVDRFPLLMAGDEIAKRYNAINQCIEKKIKLRIEYLSFKNTSRSHIIHPYKVYIYNNAWFVIGWNETVNNVGYFKINRIKDFALLKEEFVVLKTFEFSDYVDSFGMKNNGEYVQIKLKVLNQYAGVVKERLYGKNQVIESIDENTTILSCKMQNKSIIISFVLGFGSDVIVLEPQWLVDDVLLQVDKIKNIYE